MSTLKTSELREEMGKRWLLSHPWITTSADPELAKMLGATRAHWGIENSLHWVLDVIFGEDDRIYGIKTSLKTNR